ncbi:MAG: MFS transporter [Anaerolineales bacterium]|nr:MFS transporter [Anaerolineales bacterium]
MPEPRTVSYREVFRHRDFRLLWAAMSVSLSGDVLFNLALNWLILEKTGSALSVGGNLFVGVVSDLLFRTLAGALADRMNRKMLMLGSDLFRGGVVLGLFILLNIMPFHLGYLYGTTFLLGVGSNLFFPAYRAVLPNLLPPQAWLTGRALTTASARLITTVVSGVGGWVLGMGTSPAILLNGLSFFISAGLLALCRLPQQAPQKTPRFSMLTQVREGVRYVAGNRVLLGLFALLTLGDFGAAFLWPVHVVFAERVFQGGPALYGALATASLLGSFVGALMLGRFSRWFQRSGRSYFWAAAGWGMSAVLFGLNTSLPLAFVYRFLIGAALSVVSIPLATWVDAHTDDAFRGRVGATMSLGTQVVSPLAVTLSGWVADAWTPRVSYVIAGTLLLLTAIISRNFPVFQPRGSKINASPPQETTAHEGIATAKPL